MTLKEKQETTPPCGGCNLDLKLHNLNRLLQHLMSFCALVFFVSHTIITKVTLCMETV